MGTNSSNRNQKGALPLKQIIMRDFNYCDLKTTPQTTNNMLRVLRTKTTIDLFHCNVPNAYKSVLLPPLGHFDHNMEHHLPPYWPVRQREPPATNTVCVPNGESVGFSDDVCELSDVVSEYIRFCEDFVIPLDT